MADVAQLVRALVCGTRCRRFESDHPPQFFLFSISLFLCVFERIFSVVVSCVDIYVLQASGYFNTYLF